MSDAAIFLQTLFAPYADPALRLEIRCLWPAHIPPRDTWANGQPRETLSDWWPLTTTGIQAAAKTALLWQKNWNVYVGVLPRHGRKRFTQNVPAAAWLWAEIDGKAEGQSGAQQLLANALRAGLPRPALLVGSGGGVHAYWPLPTPVPLHDASSRRIFVQTLQRLATAVGGVTWATDPLGRATGKLKPAHPARPYADPACCDIARILRVPGTFNHKPERRRAVELLPASELFLSSDLFPGESPEINNSPPAWTYKQWRIKLPPPPERAPVTRSRELRHPGENTSGEAPTLPPKTRQDLQTRFPDGQKYIAARRILYTARTHGYDAFALQSLAENFAHRHACDLRPLEKLVRDTLRNIPVERVRTRPGSL